MASSGAWQEALAYRLMDPMFQSAAQGALPQLLAATAPSAKGGEHYGPGQLGGMRGAPKRQPVAPAARSQDQRSRLWSISSELTQTRSAAV